MVKKSSFLGRFKDRWKSGSGVRVARSERRASSRVPESVTARLDEGLEEQRVAKPASVSDKVAGRKLSQKEAAVVAMGEGFQELSNLVRGVQVRMEDQGTRSAAVAEDIRAMPALGRQQLDLLRRIADGLESQGKVSDKLLSTLGQVKEALDSSVLTDQRTVDTMLEFKRTMERIDGSIGRMVDNTKALARDRQADERRMVDAIREGREEDVRALVEGQRAGVERLEAATRQRMDAMRLVQDEHAAHLNKLVTINGRWTQVIIILLSLTFFALAGILTVLAVG